MGHGTDADAYRDRDGDDDDDEPYECTGVSRILNLPEVVPVCRY
eukprot:SAG31_NODE_43407_length_267_cov_0.619048_1_plen_44_part_00